MLRTSKIFLVLCLCLGLTGCFKSSEERAAEHYQSGLTLVESGDLHRAIVEFRNVLQLDEDHVEAYRQIAVASRSLGQFGEAYGFFLAVVERLPDDIGSRVALSELAFYGSNWEEFARHGEAAVKLEPERSKVRAIALGLGYRQALLDRDETGRLSVVAGAETLAEELPDNSILRRIRIDAYIAGGKTEDALRLLQGSIEEAPENMALYNLKLDLLAQLGRTDDLEAEMRNMLDVFPDEVGPRETYLRYLMSRDRSDDAEALLEDLVEKAAPEDRTQNTITLLQFIQLTKGEEAALARVDDILANPETNSGLLGTFRSSILFDLGQREEGIKALEGILSSETTNLSQTERLQTKTALARMLLANGNEVGARNQIDEVLAIDARAPAALRMRANWLISEDDTARAIADLRAVLDDKPDDTAAMVLMARALEREGKSDLMLGMLSEVVEASNNAPEHSLRYANALVADGKLLQAESTLISSLRITPGNFEVLSALGNVYLQLNDDPRAQHVVEAMRDLEDTRAGNAADLLETEILARRVGPDQALEFLRGLANIDGNVGAKLALIQANLQTGQVDEALAFAKSAVEEAPDALPLRVALALTHASARNFSEAEQELEAVLLAAPEATALYLHLARIKGAQGDLVAAQDVIDQGLEKNPDASDLLWAKASFLQDSGKIDGALEIYEDLYKNNSSNPVIANNFASLLTTYRSDQESLVRAQKIARRLKSLEVPAFQDTYGWILFRTGSVDEAISYLEPAALGLPNDARVQFHLAQAYVALERNEEGLAQMRKALNVIGPVGNSELRQEIDSEISKLEAPISQP